MAEAIIFVGLQGSGKTTYFTNHLAGTHAYVSRDVQQTAAREAGFMRECLGAERSFVVDNTNATRAVRAPYIREAKAAGFHVLCYFFDTPLRTAIGRNNHREDKKPIPVPAILRTAKHLERPSIEEGIEEIRIITAERDPAHDGTN
ncbi:MAG: ATP-binding protein [Acidobacteriaceae bacterium]|nr:ATP-binding protein [Acidobacteriaceae bacterium]MBV9502568.1 ATP-binding protein [Acidobacteriaceae bacterium]